ncbi:cationic peroxidase 1-like [Syzygium oleosum]|uniref:cationic peroxidase 1-like n=1 Tax=Syzygium oleosum TaxID=219896 RepID=UPI0024B98F1E|nr:cationic peroxidase 1-like [Syzygium oleosum]
MASFSFSMIITFSFFLVVAFVVASAQLSPNFYASSCPSALSIIQETVSTAVSSEPRMGASLLRLHYHDCFVNGCDGSVLLDDTERFTGEKTARPNVNSIRGFDVVDNIKARLEGQCPGIVSCADILAVAARDSVVALGGPTWTVLHVQLGRRDSTTASLRAANSDIPPSLSDLSFLISAFSKKGFSAKEMVALSGTHLIGRARCVLYGIRIYNEKNIDPTFAASLEQDCPRAGGEDNLASLDATGDVFDNNYFKNLVSMKGLLHSDRQLFNNGSTDSQVNTYSLDSAAFFADLADAMVKMGNLSPLTGTDGQVRTNCRKVNAS